MKTSVLLVAGMLIVNVAFGQNKKLNEIEVTAPRYQSEMYYSVNDFLKNAVEYPDKSKNAGLQGTEVVRFVVTPTGEITNFSIINSVSPEIDQEVLRVLKITDGKWNPGTADGNLVSMEKEISVSFFLHSEEEMIKMAKQYQQKGNKLMFEKNNPEKALKYFNQAIVLLPQEESLLAARGLCKYEIGDNDGAINDWNRLNTIAKNKGLNSKIENLALDFSNKKGFEKMMETIKK